MFDDLPRGEAGVLLVDPPYDFATWSPKGWKKSAHAHYGCLSLADIMALPVAELAAPDCALVLWGTQNLAEHLWSVARAWGFTPIALGAWAKQSSTGEKWAFGIGFLLRSAAEFFLVAERGKPQRLSKSQRNLIVDPDLLVAPVREHSRKPDAMYELCEALWPGPYVELFARYRREGWLQSGDQLNAQYVETTHKRLGGAPAATTPSLTHSRIGPSQAELIWHCPGSVQAQQAAGPRIAGEAAERGTDLHAQAERHLRRGTKSNDPSIAPYLDAVRAIAMRADVAPLIEQRLDLSAWHPELFGTADALVVDLAWGVLTVFDFKSGLIYVAADALQLKLYAGMAFMALPIAERRKIKWIDTVVVQPNGRMQPARRARHTVANILNTLSEYVDRAHVATDEPDPPLQAGPWCRNYFCSARTSCDAFRAFTAREAVAEFTAMSEGGVRT